MCTTVLPGFYGIQVGLLVLETKSTKDCPVPSSTVAAVIRMANGLTIELHENTSADFMKNLMGALTIKNLHPRPKRKSWV